MKVRIAIATLVLAAVGLGTESARAQFIVGPGFGGVNPGANAVQAELVRRMRGMGLNPVYGYGPIYGPVYYPYYGHYHRHYHRHPGHYVRGRAYPRTRLGYSIPSNNPFGGSPYGGNYHYWRMQQEALQRR